MKNSLTCLHLLCTPSEMETMLLMDPFLCVVWIEYVFYIIKNAITLSWSMRDAIKFTMYSILFCKAINHGVCWKLEGPIAKTKQFQENLSSLFYLTFSVHFSACILFHFIYSRQWLGLTPMIAHDICVACKWVYKSSGIEWWYLDLQCLDEVYHLDV